MTFCYTHRSVPCSALIEKFPPVADGSSYKEPQLDIMKRQRDLRTFSHKWDVSIKFLLSELREPGGRGSRKDVRARMGGGHQENKVL